MHNNAYKQPELPECFERNAEGMLKNMAIHELALLATYWGVTVDNIKSVTPDVEYSSCQTLTGPSGKEFTDFSKVGFTIETKDGVTVTVRADRCGSTTGGDSQVMPAASSRPPTVQSPSNHPPITSKHPLITLQFTHQAPS